MLRNRKLPSTIKARNKLQKVVLEVVPFSCYSRHSKLKAFFCPTLQQKPLGFYKKCSLLTGTNVFVALLRNYVVFFPTESKLSPKHNGDVFRFAADIHECNKNKATMTLVVEIKSNLTVESRRVKHVRGSLKATDTKSNKTFPRKQSRKQPKNSPHFPQPINPNQLQRNKTPPQTTTTLAPPTRHIPRARFLLPWAIFTRLYFSLGGKRRGVTSTVRVLVNN